MWKKSLKLDTRGCEYVVRINNECFFLPSGAFLVPYGVMLVVGGIPLFYMELALGQFNRKGAITCWGRLVPLFKGKSLPCNTLKILNYIDAAHLQESVTRSC